MATGDYGLPFVFTEEEVQQELARLGITNIDKASLQQFRNELQDLIQEVSASSAGFPDVSSTSAGISSGTCSDLSTDEKHMATKSPQSSSQSPLSVPSPLLTPPLSKSESNAPIALCKNFPDRTENSNGGVGYIQSAWENPTCSSPRKKSHLGRTRQVNLNSGLNQPSKLGSITMGIQQQGNVPINEEYSQDVASATTGIQKKVFTPSFEIGISDPNIEVNCGDVTDYRLRDKENAVTYTLPFTTTVLPPETNKGDSIHELGNDEFLDELLRVYNFGNSTENSNVPTKKFTKRKIVRKDSDGKSYVDESYTESESGSLLDPIEYLERLREMDKSVYDIAASDKASEFCPRAPFSVTDNNRPKSVILTSTTPPKLKKNKKSDPVNRYHQFRDYWALHKVPGENKHNELRWYIKERMLHQDQIESRPRKVYVPNNYVVPTEKHRNSLRWQIRSDLAYGLMPSLRDGNF